MPKKRVSKYPPIPTNISGPGGRVRVKMGQNLKIGEQAVIGYFDADKRIIMLDRTLPLDRQWYVFYHELAHVAYIDAGVNNLLKDDLHEALCDATATQRMRERFG